MSLSLSQRGIENKLQMSSIHEILALVYTYPNVNGNNESIAYHDSGYNKQDVAVLINTSPIYFSLRIRRASCMSRGMIVTRLA